MLSAVPNAIYDLSKIVDDPRFEGYGLVDAPSLLGWRRLREDLVPGFGISVDNPRWEQPQLSATWNNPEVEGRVVPFNDFPGINLILPAFSQRACECLVDMLTPNGELLPLETPSGLPYYFYNITTISDALDVDESKCSWDDYPFRAGSIDYYAFHTERLAGLSIFRIRQHPIEAFVTYEFVRRVYESGLNGFEFTKVWPLPKGTNWRRLRSTAKPEINPLRELKCHSLIVVLPVKGKKPDAKERRAIKKLEDELDAQLVIHSLDAPYFGSYEGSEKPPGEFRMFLSCPDADRLEEKLRPWFTHLEWPDTIRVAKRYHEYCDEDVPETWMSFQK